MHHNIPVCLATQVISKSGLHFKHRNCVIRVMGTIAGFVQDQIFKDKENDWTYKDKVKD